MRKLHWEKIPSVTTGGKPFFYIAWHDINGGKRKFGVSWNRIANQWTAYFDDMETCLVPENYGEFTTVKEAKDYLEQEFSSYL